MKQVTAANFLQALEQGARAFDTRSAASYRADPFGQLAHLPLEAVQAGELPSCNRDEPIYLVCQRGAISEVVALYLEAAGFRDVRNVAGGLDAVRREAPTARTPHGEPPQEEP